MLARGSAARVLCECSGWAEMVVVGSRGHGGVAGQRLGSVASDVAAYGHGPMVMIRGQWTVADHPPGPVVVGVDESLGSRAAIRFAFAEAELHGAPLLAVCAVADSPDVLGGAREMEAEFSKAVARWEKEHPHVTVQRQIAQASPRTALLTAATGAQLLVVGCRGREGIPGMKLGSVAQAMLHYAPCPVAVTHPADSVEQGSSPFRVKPPSLHSSPGSPRSAWAPRFAWPAVPPPPGVFAERLRPVTVWSLFRRPPKGFPSPGRWAIQSGSRPGGPILLGERGAGVDLLPSGGMPDWLLTGSDLAIHCDFSVPFSQGFTIRG